MSRVLSFCKSFFSSSTKKNTNLETSNEGEELEISNCNETSVDIGENSHNQDMSSPIEPNNCNVSNDFNFNTSDEGEELETNNEVERNEVEQREVEQNENENEGEERWKSFCETLSSSTSAKKRTYSSRNSDDDDDENRSKKNIVLL